MADRKNGHSTDPQDEIGQLREEVTSSNLKVHHLQTEVDELKKKNKRLRGKNVAKAQTIRKLRRTIRDDMLDRKTVEIMIKDLKEQLLQET